MKVPNAPDPSKPWLKTDASTFAGQNGGTQASDPSQFLSYLRGASSGITDEGTETVRGTETRKLQANLDLQKAAAKLPQDQRQAVEQAIQQLGTSTIPTQVWIDDQGRLRKMSFSIDVSNAAQGTTERGAEREPLADTGAVRLRRARERHPAAVVADLLAVVPSRPGPNRGLSRRPVRLPSMTCPGPGGAGRPRSRRRRRRALPASTVR